MTITPTQDLDLISPYPSRESGRLAGWSHCIGSAPSGTPMSASGTKSYGMIDRDNICKSRAHECPLVGAVTLAEDGRLEFSTSRKAHRLGLTKQAIEAIALSAPTVYCVVPTSNYPAISLLRSAGFKRERRNLETLLSTFRFTR